MTFCMPCSTVSYGPGPRSERRLRSVVPLSGTPRAALEDNTDGGTPGAGGSDLGKTAGKRRVFQIYQTGGGVSTRTRCSAGGCWPVAVRSDRLGCSSPVRKCPVQTRLTDVPESERQAQAPAVAWHTLSVEQVLRAEEVAAQDGLSSAEVAARADRFGPNKFAAGKCDQVTTITSTPTAS
jgi:hypothetical protein